MKVHFGLIVAATLFFVFWESLYAEQVMGQHGSDYAFFANATALHVYWRLANLGRYVAFVTLVLGHAVCFPRRQPRADTPPT
jgi:ABC-type spermidine/putrescine transport system permease subunit I